MTHIPPVHAEQMRSVVDNDELASTASEIRRRLAPSPSASRKATLARMDSHGWGRRYTRRELRSATTASASRR